MDATKLVDLFPITEIYYMVVDVAHFFLIKNYECHQYVGWQAVIYMGWEE
ncbi:MAG TPA: hypothetical protein VJ824_10315 [Bacillota bacterium]|nr:hypothetical protein [Bacillota bacterium]